MFVRCVLVAACLAVVEAFPPATEAAGTLLSAAAGFCWLLLAAGAFVFVAGWTALDEELAFGSATTDELDWSTGATEDELVLSSATFEDEFDLAFVAFDDELVLAFAFFVDELDLEEELDEEDFDEELDELESTAELDDELNELEAEDELDDELADELDEELTADELDEEDDTTAKFRVTFPVVTPIPIMLAHGKLAVFGWPDSEVAAGTSEW